ncbi:MAG TPA: HNH endonuclease [Candidatus Limnocylindria bacterium]|nr:HNH endonuclease [Candidatus Limnocylindria bacterium]
MKQKVHRAVMELALGRPLRSDEHVHHINEVKTDNRPENLEVVSPAEHVRRHHLRYPLSKPCSVCGTEFTPHRTKRRRAKTCGPLCAVEARRRARAGGRVCDPHSRD